jgi:hypothetical protein
MKIIRKQFDESGKLIDSLILKSNATRKEWLILQEKMWKKVEYSNLDIPKITNWLNKSIIHTKTGHTFEFQYVQ